MNEQAVALLVNELRSSQYDNKSQNEAFALFNEGLTTESELQQPIELSAAAVLSVLSQESAAKLGLLIERAAAPT